MTRVLPLPAPARISNGPSACSPAARCWVFSWSSRFGMQVREGGLLPRGQGFVVSPRFHCTRTAQPPTKLLTATHHVAVEFSRLRSTRPFPGRGLCTSKFPHGQEGVRGAVRLRDLFTDDALAVASDFMMACPSAERKCRCIAPRSEDLSGGGSLSAQ